MTGGVVGGRRQMGGLTADQPTAHRHQGVEMLCALAGWTRLVAFTTIQNICARRPAAALDGNEPEAPRLEPGTRPGWGAPPSDSAPASTGPDETGSDRICARHHGLELRWISSIA